MDQKKVLIDYLNLKVLKEDWRAVIDAAIDLRLLSSSQPKVSQGSIKEEVLKGKDVPLAAIPPVEMEIPHHQSEVVNLLRLTPEELVDRMFPDYTLQESEA